MTKNQKLSLVIIALVILLGLYFINSTKSANNLGKNLASSNSESTTTNSDTVTSVLSNPGGAKTQVEQLQLNQTTKNIPMPDYSKPITVDKNLVMSDEAKNLYTSKIKDLQAGIAKTPDNLSLWMDLAMFEKAVGNYDSAKTYWIYVSEKAPSDFVSLGNLGNLYAYYLKDGKVAVDYYNKALARDPKREYLYIQLAEVYRDVFHNRDMSRSIIDQGLKELPLDRALLEFKNSL